MTHVPGRLLEASLDTLSRRLVVDCCWVQIIIPDDNKLSLSAHHGFTPYMRDRIATMELSHPFGQEIVGIGNTIIIPDLCRDGHFDIPLFKEAGFRSLMAVPIMTYRVNGILGLACRAKKRFTKEYSYLITAIAGVIGMALNKCVLLEQMDGTGKKRISDNTLLSLSTAAISKTNDIKRSASEVVMGKEQLSEGQGRENSGAYEKHLYRMRLFSDSHKASDNN
ncbi:MAG: hypothetical protein A2144_02065 [Chloroflexi bacterium RBG_16_50_9]|nr:MAG: hypothetical protein A2144_02065 [Chloroflexi bacterium RBG_16_50_9]